MQHYRARIDIEKEVQYHCVSLHPRRCCTWQMADWICEYWWKRGWSGADKAIKQSKANQVCLDDIATYISWDRGVRTRLGDDWVVLVVHKNWNLCLSHTVWVHIVSWSCGLQVSLFLKLLIEQFKAVSCVILIQHWFEGSFAVLCYQW